MLRSHPGGFSGAGCVGLAGANIQINIKFENNLLKMSKNPLRFGLILFIITMIIFFAVYYFYNGLRYFEVTMMANSFILPLLYALAGFISVRLIYKKQNYINFRTAFKNSFYPMFIGGFLSIASMFTFLNFVDPSAKDLLNYQFAQTNKNELTSVYEKEKARLKTDEEKLDLEKDYQASLQSYTEEQLKGKDVFTLRYFSFFFAAILMYDLIFSLFLAAFFRSRNREDVLEETA